MAANDFSLSSLLAQAGLDDAQLALKSAPAMRAALKRTMPFLEAEPPRVETADDVHVAGADGPLNARVYIPYDADRTGAGLVFFHGGGYVTGDIETHDPLCRRLAAVSGVRIVSVEYRLAPEHKFPAAADDALAAFDTVHAGRLSAYGFKADRLAVGGDSAGGGLAAMIAQTRRRQVTFQLLIYPLLQLVEVKTARPRWQDGPLLSAEMLRRIRKTYLTAPDSQARDIRVSPLFADDLSGLAPAFILAAELDPLLDEGRVYADRLAAFGVPVSREVIKGAPHGFANMSKASKAAIPAIETAAKALARGLSSPRKAPAGP